MLNLDSNNIIDMYLNKEMTLVEIGKEVGATASTIYLLLKKNNITRRKAAKRYTDIKGIRSGKLVAKEYKGIIKGQSYWLCDCDCGGQHVVSAKQLIRGDKKKRTVSCGCMNYLGLSGEDNPMYIDGRTKDPTYSWCKEHPEIHTAQQAKRRATKKNQTPDNANLQKIQLYYSICAYLNSNCEVPMWHVDHIKPISKGGFHHEDNLQILTAAINLQKKDKWPLTEEEQVLYKGVTI